MEPSEECSPNLPIVCHAVNLKSCLKTNNEVSLRPLAGIERTRMGTMEVQSALPHASKN
jgi:hypothetical protein